MPVWNARVPEGEAMGAWMDEFHGAWMNSMVPGP